MSDPYLGEIRAFGFPFAPKDWASCNGQTLSIAQNQALFSLLGTTYGGNGSTTFQLPNLQGMVAIGQAGNAPVGQASGDDHHTLAVAEMPSHSHAIGAVANGTTSATNIPSGATLLGSASTDQPGNPPVMIYGPASSMLAMLPLGPAGANQPHENRMPFLVMSYCIALAGIYPSRN